MPIFNTFNAASSKGYGFSRGSSDSGPILISANPAPSATITTYTGYIVFAFKSSGTLVVDKGSPGLADVYVVAGGGTGSSGYPGGQGGPGGYGGGTATSPGFTITSNSPIPVVIGGSDTNSSFGPLTAIGGGGVQGGVDGLSLANPGPPNSYETGSPLRYAGGGNAGGQTGSPDGQRGGGPGGFPGGPRPAKQGGPRPGTPGTPGGANLGGGGGGGGAGNGFPVGGGGAGGSGIVIIRFPNTSFRTS